MVKPIKMQPINAALALEKELCDELETVIDTYTYRMTYPQILGVLTNIQYNVIVEGKCNEGLLE